MMKWREHISHRGSSFEECFALWASARAATFWYFARKNQERSRVNKDGEERLAAVSWTWLKAVREKAANRGASVPEWSALASAGRGLWFEWALVQATLWRPDTAVVTDMGMFGEWVIHGMIHDANDCSQPGEKEMRLDGGQQVGPLMSRNPSQDLRVVEHSWRIGRFRFVGEMSAFLVGGNQKKNKQKYATLLWSCLKTFLILHSAFMWLESLGGELDCDCDLHTLQERAYGSSQLARTHLGVEVTVSEVMPEDLKWVS